MAEARLKSRRMVSEIDRPTMVVRVGWLADQQSESKFAWCRKNKGKNNQRQNLMIWFFINKTLIIRIANENYLHSIVLHCQSMFTSG